MIYDREYIQERVVITDSGCWEWQNCTDRLGYGQVSRLSSGESLAHRLSYRIFKGSVDGLVIRHTCDNPPCCNPDHLLGGTQGDNLYDAVQKGRLVYQKAFKVTEAYAAGIKRYLIAGVPQRTIAKLYNISESHLSTLKHKLLKDETL